MIEGRNEVDSQNPSKESAGANSPRLSPTFAANLYSERDKNHNTQGARTVSQDFSFSFRGCRRCFTASSFILLA